MIIKSFFFGVLAAAAVAAGSAVIDLDPTNFDEVVLRSGIPTLVEFYAPWCGHCKTLAPIYEQLGSAFANTKTKVQIAKVDADANRDLGKRFGVQGFPTLKYFDGKSEKPLEYNSGRDLESLSKYIMEKTGIKAAAKRELPSNVQVLNDSTFSSAVGGDKNVLVAFTAPWCGHCKNLAPIWEELAHDYARDENVVIAKVDADAPNGKRTAQKYDVTSYPTIKWFKAGSDEAVAYEGGRQEKDFVDWVNSKAGTHRLPGGDLDVTSGTVESLDSLIAKISGAPTLANLGAEVKAQAEKLKDTAQYRYAEYYVRVFDKLNSNNDFVSKELARLDGMLQRGGLAPAKRDEIQNRTNVLRKFAEMLAKKVAEVKDEL